MHNFSISIMSISMKRCFMTIITYRHLKITSININFLNTNRYKIINNKMINIINKTFRQNFHKMRQFLKLEPRIMRINNNINQSNKDQYHVVK